MLIRAGKITVLKFASAASVMACALPLITCLHPDLNCISISWLDRPEIEPYASGCKLQSVDFLMTCTMTSNIRQLRLLAGAHFREADLSSSSFCCLLRYSSYNQPMQALDKCWARMNVGQRIQESLLHQARPEMASGFSEAAVACRVLGRPSILMIVEICFALLGSSVT